MAIPCFCEEPISTNKGDIKFCKKCNRVINNYSNNNKKTKMKKSFISPFTNAMVYLDESSTGRYKLVELDDNDKEIDSYPLVCYRNNHDDEIYIIDTE